MHKNSKNDKLNPLGRLKILLPGLPSRSNRGWFGYCSVVLFPLGGGWALFDTGHYSDRALLLEAFKAVRIDPAAIRLVVLSHLHFDHILNLSLFKNAAVVIAQSELDYAQSVSAGKIEDASIPDFWPVLLAERDVKLVDESMELEEGLEVVNLPGHTPGCLTMFYEEATRIAICGDVIKNGWEALTGEAVSPGVENNRIDQNIKQITNRSDVIVPGHDRPFRIRNDGLVYLTDYTWEVYGNFCPQPCNEVLLKMDLKQGFYKAV